MKYFFIYAILLFLLILPLNALALEVNAQIKYVTADGVYIDAGSDADLHVGDKGKVYQNNKVIAELEVLFTAQNSASCIVLNNSGTIKIGDKVVVIIQKPVKGNQVLPDDVEATTPAETAAKAVSVFSRTTPDKKQQTYISGYAGLQYYFQDDISSYNNDYSQPSFSTRLRINNIFTPSYSMNIRLRARKNIRNDNSTSDWNNRIYNLSFEYDNSTSPYSYKLGRILTYQISGLGALDGAMTQYRFRDNYSIGVFGGSQPDLQNTDFQSDVLKTGVFIHKEADRSLTNQMAGTLAFAGKYDQGEISKEFIYQQITYNLFSKLFIYESSEIGLNRGWRKDAEGQTLSLSNILVNMKYSLNKRISFTLGVDNRTLVRTIEYKNTPDSLFDDSYRRGIRSGMRIQLPAGYWLSLSGGKRFRESENTTSTYAFNLSKSGIFGSNAYINLSFNSYSNDYSTGHQPAIMIRKYFFNNIGIQLASGINQYEFQSNNGSKQDYWIKTGADYQFLKHYYFSLYGEVYRGDSFEANTVFIETGYRF